jgi:putative ABC transport system permease protein
MRHPLNWLLRFGRSESDRQAILGDLEEEYRSRVRPTRSWLGAHAWYAGQVVSAAVASQGRYQTMASTEARSRWRLFVMTDVRYALRRWRRRPGFALTAILTLGLGIGAATAMFSVVDAVLLQPLPWAEPDRLALVHAVYPERRSDLRYATTWDRQTLHYPAWDALRQGSSFESVAVWRMNPLEATVGEDRAEIVDLMWVSSNFLSTLGIQMALGRNFTAEEDDVSNTNIILTYEAWQRRFGGDPDVLDRPIIAGSASSGGQFDWTVVGILEPGFTFDGQTPEILRPVGVGAETGRRYFSGSFRAVVRLKPGVSAEAAAAEAASLVAASDPNEPASARVVPLVEEHLGASARPLWLLFGGAGVLLLVACANVAGLLLGEGRARRHEIAIRLALGVSGGRIVRQLLAEHVLLAAAGAAAGLALSVWLTQGLVAVAPDQLPRVETVHVNWRVAAFALGVGGVTMLLFGLAPAFSLARTRATEMLSEGGREATPGRQWPQRATVACEVALALVLVVGAALLGETMYRLLSQPLGFDPSNVAIASTQHTGSPLGPEYLDALRRARQTPGADVGARINDWLADAGRTRTREVLDRLATVPGVVEAAASRSLPLFANPITIDIHLPQWPAGQTESVRQHGVTERFLRAMRTPVLAGRDFELEDWTRADRAAIVSQEMARRLFPDGAVGRRFENIWNRETGATNSYEVIGVVPDVRQRGLVETADPMFYFLGSLTVVGPTQFIVRTSTPAEASLPALRQAIAEANPQVVVTSTHTMASLLGRTIAQERFRAMLSAGFAGTALVLAAVGLYGVAARRVAERRRELGVRVALGAQPANLRALVLRDASLTVGLGLAIGLPAAFAASQVTSAFLFGVSSTAPHVFIVASAVLAAAALTATFLPARRASRTDPMLALRD